MYYALSSFLLSLPLLAFSISCQRSDFSGNQMSQVSGQESLFQDATAGKLEKVGPVSDTPKELSVRLFASASTQGGVDPCRKPPLTFEFVSTRLSPFAFCVSGHGRKSPELELCLETNSSLPVDQLADSCWTKKADFESLALLTNGRNLLRLHVRDGKGNYASDDAIVTLDPGIAPEIRILSPDQAAVSRGFERSRPIRLVFEVTDNDTKIENIKVIVQLTNPSGNSGVQPLGCNFANSKRWRQCPEGSTTSSSDFVIDARRNTFSYQLTIPADYDTTKPHVIMITAIDQSGNAAITATAELGSGFEVVAGRAYKGVGGSGSTIQPIGTGGLPPMPIADKFGNLYLINSRTKINPFDSRLCRAIKAPTDSSSIADCPDIIVSDFVPAQMGWAYDAEEDVFYAAGGMISNGSFALAKISFSKGEITLLSSITSATDVASIDYGSSVDLSTHRFFSLENYLYFESVSRRLYFRSKDTFFIREQNNQIRKLVGNGTSENDTATQASILPSAMRLPMVNNGWFYPFIVSKDGRIVMTAVKRTGSAEGAGLGKLYVIEGLSAGDHQSPATLLDLQGATDLPQFFSMFYQPRLDLITAAESWIGTNQIQMPPPMTDLSAVDAQIPNYKRNDKKDLVSLPNGKSISTFLKEEQQRTEFPLSREVPGLVYNVALANSNYMYFVDSLTNFVMGYDFRSRKIEPIIGHVDNLGVIESSMNRRLDFPKTISADASGRIIFSDLKGIHRATLSNGSFSVDTIVEGGGTLSFIGWLPFALNPSRDRLLRLGNTTNTLEVLNLNNPSAGFTSTIFRSSPSPEFRGDYIIQSGFGFFADGRPRYIDWRTDWDGIGVEDALLSAYELPPLNASSAPALQASSHILSHTDFYSDLYPNCSGGRPCNTSVMPAFSKTQGTLSGTNDIDTASFRLTGIASGTRGNWTTPVFLNDDQVLTCLKHKDFRGDTDSILGSVAVISIANKRIQFQPIDCLINQSHFYMLEGRVFHGYYDQIHEISLANFTSTSVALVAAIPRGTHIGGLYVDAEFVYYSDITTDRVIRIKRR